MTAAAASLVAGRRAILLVVAAACAGSAPPPPVTMVAEPPPPPPPPPLTPPLVAVAPPPVAMQAAANEDPALVTGRWSYRTSSNCGTVVGTGVVKFEWDAGSATYAEVGTVHWSDSGATIDWWGRDRFDAPTRTLSGEISNSLGDQVRATWQLEGGPPPRRLTIRWTQTNGCYGEGVATR